MAYVSLDELESFGLNPGALIGFTEAQRTAAVATAQSEADGYMGTVLAVPLEPVPDAVKLHVARMAVYYLMTTRGIDPDGPDRIFMDNYRAAIKFFESVAKRLITLGTQTEPPLDDPSDNDDTLFVFSATARGYSTDEV